MSIDLYFKSSKNIRLKMVWHYFSSILHISTDVRKKKYLQKQENCYRVDQKRQNITEKCNEIFHDANQITRFNKELSTSNKSHNRIYHIRTSIAAISFASNAHELASTSNQAASAHIDYLDFVHSSSPVRAHSFIRSAHLNVELNF